MKRRTRCECERVRAGRGIREEGGRLREKGEGGPGGDSGSESVSQ